MGKLRPKWLSIVEGLSGGGFRKYTYEDILFTAPELRVCT